MASKDVAPRTRLEVGDPGTSRLERRWCETYAELRAWVAAAECWPSRSSRGATERRLANWVAFQRRRRASGALAGDRIRLLDALPGWQQTTDDKWCVSYRTLAQWVRDHGCFPSRTSDDPDELRLARWADTQRRVWRRTEDGSSGAMAPDREALLEALPGWQWTPREQAWRESYDALVTWVADAGLQPSPAAADETERHLAYWAGFQRELLRRHTEDEVDATASDRRALLEAIPGWRPLPPRRPQEEAWSESCGELAEWVRMHGRFPSSSSREPVERRLARWAVHQRSVNRRGGRGGASLRADRATRLEAIPGWQWSPPSGRRRS